MYRVWPKLLSVHLGLRIKLMPRTDIVKWARHNLASSPTSRNTAPRRTLWNHHVFRESQPWSELSVVMCPDIVAGSLRLFHQSGCSQRNVRKAGKAPFGISTVLTCFHCLQMSRTTIRWIDDNEWLLGIDSEGDCYPVERITLAFDLRGWGKLT
jgi:hypothetical protein